VSVSYIPAGVKKNPGIDALLDESIGSISFVDVCPRRAIFRGCWDDGSASCSSVIKEVGNISKTTTTRNE
jgi:hypothetical protein